MGASTDTARGLGFALGTYVIWGLQPLYVALLAHLPATEVLAHRIIWSLPLALLLIAAMRAGSRLQAAIADSRTVLLLAFTGGLITLNWGFYIWAITADRAMEAALGYYISPLFSVLLGWLVLGEQLGPRQKAAVALAGLAVIVLMVGSATIPFAGLLLTLTFGIYGLVRKMMDIDPNVGFCIEVALYAPLCLLALVWMGAGVPANGDLVLLMGFGLVTLIPMVGYAWAARGLTLSTLGILFYLTPTIVFLLAVFHFGEPLDTARMIAFPLIWLALGLYAASLLRRRV
ncbi:MAG: EamA family transporter RarD [Shimia sp.]